MSMHIHMSGCTSGVPTISPDLPCLRKGLDPHGALRRAFAWECVVCVVVWYGLFRKECEYKEGEAIMKNHLEGYKDTHTPTHERAAAEEEM